MVTLFESVAAGFDTSSAPNGGGVIQWEFLDAEPWHVVVANGSTVMSHDLARYALSSLQNGVLSR